MSGVVFLDNFLRAFKTDRVILSFRATAIHSKIAALQAELDGVKQEAREQVVLSMRVKGEGQPSPSGRKRKKGPAENSPGFAYSKVRDWILNNSGKKVMEGVEAILEAAGGLEVMFWLKGYVELTV